MVKAILENAYLNDDQIVEGSRLGEDAAEFIKTSTGFAPGGATVHDLLLMVGATSSKVQIKAAGGVRTLGRLLDARALCHRGHEIQRNRHGSHLGRGRGSSVPAAQPYSFRPHPANKTLLRL